MEIITCEADLRYVNKKLKRWLIDKALAEQRKATNVQKAAYRRLFPVNKSPCSAFDVDYSDGTVSSAYITTFAQAIPHADFDRFFISPDSETLCNDKDCPVTNPHNNGRFYHNGQRAESPSSTDFETRLGSVMVPVSHFFNYTVPPPDITEAYLRMAEGQGSISDEEMVRRYKMNHCWSPIVSECPTARPKTPDVDTVSVSCLIFPPEKANKTLDSFLFDQLEAHIDEEVETLIHPAFRSSSPRKCCGEKCPPTPLRRNASRSQRAKPGRTMDAKDCKQPKLQRVTRADSRRPGKSNNRPYGQPVLRRRPKAENLRQAQLKLKESIVNKIAEQAIDECQSRDLLEVQTLDSHGCHKSICDTPPINGSRTASIFNDEGDEGPEELDRKLEILAALIKKLKQCLNEGSYREFSLPSQAKDQYEHLRDVLLIVRRAFQQQLGDFSRSFRPTGVKISDQELETMFEEYLSIYEMLLDRYPSMTTQEIVGSLNKIGPRAKVENLC
ncbi:MAG: hypothetical protein Q9217_006071 [Psora testacea]